MHTNLDLLSGFNSFSYYISASIELSIAALSMHMMTALLANTAHLQHVQY